MFKKTIQSLVDAACDNVLKEKSRTHLGFSGIAAEDQRDTFLKFRWSIPDNKDARMKRLLRLGHIVEDEVAQYIRAAEGLTLSVVNPDTNEQYGWKLMGGHFAGSCDGMLLGHPESPKKWHVWEMKTAKDARYKELEKVGWANWDAAYLGQSHCYMGASGVDRHVSTTYNKDTSHLHWGRTRFEPQKWAMYQLDAQNLLTTKAIPDSPYSKNDYRIKNYKDQEYKDIYYGDKLPKPNCRNCKHANIMFDGDSRWHCIRLREDRTPAQQRVGCERHLYMTTFLTQKLADHVEDHGIINRYSHRPEKFEFWNAEDPSGFPGQHVYTSQDLYHIVNGGTFNLALLGDPNFIRIRAAFSGDIIATKTIGAEQEC